MIHNCPAEINSLFPNVHHILLETWVCIVLYTVCTCLH